MSIFISHSSQDDAFVVELRQKLEAHDLTVWADSRNLSGGDKLKPKITEAIQTAEAFIVIVSHHALQSEWVFDEVALALQVQSQGNDKYRVIPILLGEVKPTTLRAFFNDKEKLPLAVTVRNEPGGLSEAMPAILAALGEALPNEPQPMVETDAPPMAELVLTLSDLRVITVPHPDPLPGGEGNNPHPDPLPLGEGNKATKGEGEVVLAKARATLSYKPASEGEREVVSKPFAFTMPLMDMTELRWYVERYIDFPTGNYAERAKRLEGQLPQWGLTLYQAMNGAVTQEAWRGWQGVAAMTDRRFTVVVDEAVLDEAEQGAAKEAATLLLGLPWELLHDGRGYLFQGQKPLPVRRSLPNYRPLDALQTSLPLRTLLICARPEEQGVGYINHRAIAQPLVEALLPLGELVELTMLTPPTFEALRETLQAARVAGRPFQIVHFDGHGVFDKRVGLGQLCFELPQDCDKLSQRRAELISASRLAEVLREARIPLFFLNACQSAQAANDPTSSVAVALLNEGVASVVAMSYSVLVETARRFVGPFYAELVRGGRIGEAMLQGRQSLYGDSYRHEVFGQPFHLQDWFVPVLFQEREDCQLLPRRPSPIMQELDRKVLASRWRGLPEPKHQFIGRSRELLALERLLQADAPRYAVLCGEGGEGKTALACEWARWAVMSRQVARAAFLEVETTQEVRVLVDRLGQQLVSVGFSVAKFESLEQAMLPIRRALQEARTVIIVDNLESLQDVTPNTPPSVPPIRGEEKHPHPDPLPGGDGVKPPSLWGGLRGGIGEGQLAGEILTFCHDLMGYGQTRLILTTRTPLPAPFDDAPKAFIRLSRLTKGDALELVKQLLPGLPKAKEAAMHELIEAVRGHAGSLVLLAPQLPDLDMSRLTAELHRLMAEMEAKHPNERERSLFASVALSVNRLPKEILPNVQALAVFQGGAYLWVWSQVLGKQQKELVPIAHALVHVGLAEFMPYNHLRLHPALAPYLYGQLADPAPLQAKWAEGMRQFTDFLYEQQFQDAQLSAILTQLELPNLMYLLTYLTNQAASETVVQFATRLEQLLERLGRPTLMQQVVAVRAKVAATLSGWSSTRFNGAKAEIERLLQQGNLQAALTASQQLLETTLQSGATAYQGAGYDITMAFVLLGRVLKNGSMAQPALELFQQAHDRFAVLAAQGNQSAAGMTAVTLTEQGNCFTDLGRFQEAVQAYQASIEQATQLKNRRQVAVGQIQLGTVRYFQRDYQAALTAYQQACKQFSTLNEPATLATVWHQMGMAYEELNQDEAAESAYQQSLVIKVQLGDVMGEANTLNQLGNLYDRMGRLEEAVGFYRQAIKIDIKLQDQFNEGKDRSNMADTLIKLHCYGEARRELQRAIECKQPFGHVAGSWTTWHNLYQLEQAEGQVAAAQAARAQAMATFLAYRRAGGENHDGEGQICARVGQAIQAGQTAGLAEWLTGLVEDDAGWGPLVGVLLQVVAGSRDLALAEEPSLDFMMAVEVRLLVEGLGGATANGEKNE